MWALFLNILPDLTGAAMSVRTASLLGTEKDVREFRSQNASLDVLASCVAFNPAEWEAGALADRNAFPVILLDATQGVRDLDRTHAHIARFFPFASPLVLVGRMDEIGFEQEQYDLIVEEYRGFLNVIGSEPLAILPAPLDRLAQLDWYDGPDLETVVSSLAHPPTAEQGPLRIQVKSMVNAEEHWRLEGFLLSGQLAAGDTVLSSPSNQTAFVSEVHRKAHVAPEPFVSSEITLVFHEPVFIEPGEVLSHVNNAPVETDVFRACVRWSGAPAKVGETLECVTGYGSFVAELQSIDRTLDPVRPAVLAHDSLKPGVFSEIVLRTQKIVALDSFNQLPSGGRLQLLDEQGEDLCSGFISMEGYGDQRPLLGAKPTNITPVQHGVTQEDRSGRNGHKGGVLWFTGLSGSGKTTLALALEAQLFKKGYQVFVMDGDNVRQGLTSNLGFSPADRAENIRRAGEVAALFRQAGVIVISSFISPYRSDRDRARHAAYSGFHEIYIKADIETCIARDPKGLYKRALRGDIRDFTGISAPYEKPGAADLVIDTEREGVEVCVERLVKYVDRNFRV